MESPRQHNGCALADRECHVCDGFATFRERLILASFAKREGGGVTNLQFTCSDQIQ